MSASHRLPSLKNQAEKWREDLDRVQKIAPQQIYIFKLGEEDTIMLVHETLRTRRGRPR